MIYYYDNTFDGLMTTIFEIYAAKDNEAMIEPIADSTSITLFSTRNVTTNEAKSNRVQKGLRSLGREVLEHLYKAWLSREEGIEDLMLSVIRIGFSSGKNPFQQRTHDAVCKLDSVRAKVSREAERMLQFIRFKKLDDNLYAADIEPEYDVLELVGDHFHNRFPQSRFIIRNLRHLTAIVASPSGWHITTLPEDNPPLPKDGEYENLWRVYFKTIANESRKNLKLQQHFVPLKYRKHLTEFREHHQQT
jgi:probable DNA metabolism protein